MNVYGENLKKLRREKGSSQEEIARFAEIKSKSTISKYERGDIMPALDVAKKIADFFGVSVDSMTIRTQIIENTITERNSKELIGLPKEYINAIKIAYNNNISPEKLIELIDFTTKLRK
ncbi:MAG: hypothetical protein CVV02_15250 [Firmicutes bacterium HGW-Firmicutes-7]|nr:MAG: hypothetical protein CVV02_15250 [Firmicutes bacterium HGW-Firmicutes-7]